MKKKVFSILIFLLFTGHLSFCQRVYFSDTTNYWITEHTIGGGGGDPLQISHHTYSFTDTLIEWNGYSYNLLIDPYGKLLIRDDTNAHVVYVKALSSNIGQFKVLDTTNEFIYMDYNLNIGDNLQTH